MGESLHTYRGHRSWVRSVSVRPDNQVIAIISTAGAIMLWACQSGQCLKTLTGHAQ
ncbi:MAG: hypothetical protein QNJ46_03995 [Leptolyngbyaceae cyanobacterium MO_188.B28]|nr:hypothetical protein [Leptolyngbyaceae cyanobacterium MO_188.B28]